ncbi:dehydrogenase [Thiohalocapsa marina]|uniref:Dehydrogenase n=1 Tax=Thiohalocapsa marina TaxID=424902 RepID=A0A5M8FG52_9GAMM|nr:zinc-binding alcohol dehydrogenase [Thiohalocapsa marina]KAA6183853.1 dehydrogenase [Thiohalocapsa marina]
MSGSTTARAYWLCRPGHGELRQEPLPPLAPGQARVRTLYSAISRGTETLIHRGEVPPSLYADMRAPFQQGAFPGPLKYGYMTVGVVEALGDDPAGDPANDLPGPRLNQPVFCLHPHQDRFQVPWQALHPVPTEVPAARAVLAANLETAVNAVWDAGVSVGDRVLVVGGGVVGLLAGWLCARMPGTRVVLVDPQDARAGVAAALGMQWQPRIQPADHPPPFDIAIHASGRPEGLAGALPLLGDEGRLVDLSWYGTRPVELPLGAHFHPRRLRLIASQVGQLPPDRRPRWSHTRRLRLALALLADPVLDRLITDESAFASLPAVLAELATPGAAPDTLCHRIRYPTAEGF